MDQDLDGLDPGPFMEPKEDDFKPTNVLDFPTLDSLSSKSDTALEELRRACLVGRDSLYVFSKVLLGYSLMNERVHLPMARFAVQTRRRGGRRIMLMPRGHLKTTIWTIADTMQQLCADPNLQFLVVADTGLNAQQFMREIQNHFQYNELFRVVMHDLVPDNLNHVIWNQNQMEVERPNRISRGPSIDAIGALGGSESRHYHRIKADDLVTEKCIRSDVEMEKVTKWAGGLESLLVRIVEDQLDFVGSRKKKGDLYEQQEKYYGDGYVPEKIGPHAVQRGPVVIFSRHAEENGEVIFPEVLSKDFLVRLRKYDPQRYHAQYGNSPKGEGVNTFDIESLRTFRWGEQIGNTGVHKILCIHGDKLLKEVSPWNLERMIVFDPSVAEKQRSSKQAMHVIAKGGDPERFVLESRVGHYTPTEAIDYLFELRDKWNPTIISIERRGFQGWVKYWIHERAEMTGVSYLPVVEWPAEGEVSAQWAKTEHIRSLQPIIRANLLWVHQDNLELIDDIEFYPNVMWDDSLDALAQGPTYWPFSIDETELRNRKRIELNYLDQTILGLPADENRKVEVFNEQEFLQQLDATGYMFLRA